MSFIPYTLRFLSSEQPSNGNMNSKVENKKLCWLSIVRSGVHHLGREKTSLLTYNTKQKNIQILVEQRLFHES
jgi:hypothetical protein